jgi:RimJ/RimL family protein N-acetyltransferase
VRVIELTAAHADDIVTWAYPPPYEAYSLTGADPGYFTDPANGFVALIDDEGLVGYRSFGPDGRVAGGPYNDTALHTRALGWGRAPANAILDTGGGLRPSLTGRGLGRTAIAVGLAYGKRVRGPRAWRVTVSSTNARALRVVEALGFRRVIEFTTGSGLSYWILLRET